MNLTSSMQFSRVGTTVVGSLTRITTSSAEFEVRLVIYSPCVEDFACRPSKPLQRRCDFRAGSSWSGTVVQIMRRVNLRL